MKPSLLRPLTVAALFLFAALCAAPAAHAQFGIAGGANFDRIGDIGDGDNDLNFDNATGYHIGAFYDFAFGPVGVRPGVFYMDVGSFDAEGNFGIDGAPDTEDFDLSLIEVPIDLRYRIVTPLLKPYVTAGPVVRFVADSGDTFDDATNDFSVAGNVGLGTDIGIPLSSLGFFVELRYSFGLSPIAEDFEFGGADFTVDDDTNLNNFMLRAGVKF